jgi:DNA (cytosine-5)-methyltransferase 1
MIGATLFSGIGAPEVAMPEWEWPWHAETEKFPATVMAARHLQSVNLGDVTADDFCERAAEIAIPDIIVFGSPCQDFSVAGKRLGLDGARGNLALIALGIVDRLKPRWFCFENVSGLLSNWSGGADCPPDSGGRWEGDENHDFAAFLGAVDEFGYSGAWAVLDAQHFDLAQRRERVFFVGHSDWRRAAAVLLEPESLCGDTPPRREAGEGATHDVAPSLGASGRGFDRAGDTQGQDPVVAMILNAKVRIDFESETFVATSTPPLTGNQYGDHESREGLLVAHSLRADGFDAGEDGTGRGTPLVAFSCKDHGADASEQTAPTLRAGGHDKSHANAGVMPAVAFSENTRHEPREMDMAPALSGGGGKPGQGFSAVRQGYLVRRLTPVECARLQGFPDDYLDIEYRGKPAADGPRYKALGNSMAVPVMRWILTRIEMVNNLAEPANAGHPD